MIVIHCETKKRGVWLGTRDSELIVWNVDDSVKESWPTNLTECSCVKEEEDKNDQSCVDDGDFAPLELASPGGSDCSDPPPRTDRLAIGTVSAHSSAQSNQARDTGFHSGIYHRIDSDSMINLSYQKALADYKLQIEKR
jgi:hypothetical protein